MNKFALDHPAGAGALSPLNYLIRSPLGVKNWFGGIVLAVFTLFLAAPAQAVHVSSSGSGQALIVPFYTVENGFDTLVSVTNTLETDASAAALKLHFISADGELQHSFNLYLHRLSTWAVALSEQDGQTASGLFEAGCLLGDDGGMAVSMEQFELPATHGYIEIIEMGRLTDSELLGALGDDNCDAFEESWSDAVLEPPAGGVRASASLINVARATMYSFDATALDNFRDAVMHTAPGEALPDLSSAKNHPDHTTSSNCNISPCVEDAWDAPVDAVSAALMAREVKGEFVISPSIEARTEWIVTFPMERFYPQEHPINDPGVSFFNSSRSGATILPPAECLPFPLPYCQATTEAVLADRSVTILEFLEHSQPDGHESAILGASAHIPVVPVIAGSELVTTGFARLGFSTDGLTSLESNAGKHYLGRPMVSLILQRFTRREWTGNGEQVVSQYGNSFRPTYSLERSNAQN